MSQEGQHPSQEEQDDVDPKGQMQPDIWDDVVLSLISLGTKPTKVELTATEKKQAKDLAAEVFQQLGLTQKREC